MKSLFEHTKNSTKLQNKVASNISSEISYSTQAQKVAPENIQMLDKRFEVTLDSHFHSILKHNFYDLLSITMDNIAEGFTFESSTSKEFQVEWDEIVELNLEDNFEDLKYYGTWYYYPKDNSLVRYALKRWHKLALRLRNSSLASPINEPHNWKKTHQLHQEAIVLFSLLRILFRVDLLVLRSFEEHLFLVH